MKVEQFVMAYSIEHDRIRALLPKGFSSLRPVLRINGEITDGSRGYLELNTPVEKGSFRGWLNIGFWENVSFRREGETTLFYTDQLEIFYTETGSLGGCPAEKDNDGCYFADRIRPSETIDAFKEYCHCRFAWKNGSFGESTGIPLPAYPTAPVHGYPPQELTPENAASIPCAQVLGSYRVTFERN